jgi:hypothetical protein
MTILVYPDRQSSFTLYEDDGETIAYRNGAFVLVGFECEKATASVRVRVGAPQGKTDLYSTPRSYTLKVHSAIAPQSVETVGSDGGAYESLWSFDGCFLNCVVIGAPAQITLRY